jgi:hypothetical protein
VSYCSSLAVISDLLAATPGRVLVNGMKELCAAAAVVQSAPKMTDLVPSTASSTAVGGRCNHTSPSSILTGNVMSDMLVSSSSKHSPVFKLKFFLCSGHATLGKPSLLPMMPCDSTRARLCGHTFWVAYHSCYS